MSRLSNPSSIAPVSAVCRAVVFLLSTGFGAISVASASPVASAEPIELPDELRSGYARFSLLTGDPLTALAINPQPETREQRLLHAQALSDLGLYQAARTGLETLAGDGSDISSHAALELIRLAVKTQDTEQTQRWLDEFLPRLQGEERQEALFYQAEILRQKDDLAAAAAVLQKMGNNTWTGLGYFNLAAGYAQIDTSGSRPLVSLRVATSTAQDKTPGSLDLVDRANLGGGLLALRDEDYSKAVNFLERVRLDSYQAPRALYLHGLAKLKQDNVRAALQSWHRARKFPLAFAGAAEAYIAMGQAYDEAGSSSQAADAFLSANAVFRKEQAVLSELETSVRDQGAYRAFLAAGHENEVEWFLADSQTVTAPRLAWLIRFMEEPEAQRAVQRLAELERMGQRLEQKLTELSVLKSSVEERIAGAQTFSRSGKGATDRERMQQRIDDLSAELTRLKSQAAAQGGGRYARLQDIDAQLGRAESVLATIVSEAKTTPSQLKKSLSRVDSARERISRQLQRISTLRKRSDEVLGDQMLAFLAKQQSQLERFADRSEQEIARLYEYMAVSRIRAERRREEAAP